MGHQSLDPARDTCNRRLGSHPTVWNRIVICLNLHVQIRSAIAGSQTGSGSPAAGLPVTLSETESLFGQRESRSVAVSLRQGWICFWVPMGRLWCLYSDHFALRNTVKSLACITEKRYGNCTVSMHLIAIKCDFLKGLRSSSAFTWPPEAVLGSFFSTERQLHSCCLLFEVAVLITIHRKYHNKVF